jgi:hypothetical protein
MHIKKIKTVPKDIADNKTEGFKYSIMKYWPVMVRDLFNFSWRLAYV